MTRVGKSFFWPSFNVVGIVTLDAAGLTDAERASGERFEVRLVKDALHLTGWKKGATIWPSVEDIGIEDEFSIIWSDEVKVRKYGRAR